MTGRPLREKIKRRIKKYFTLDNLSKYGPIMSKFVGRYFIWVSGQYLKKKDRAILVKKIGGRKKIVKIRFRLFYDKKNLMNQKWQKVSLSLTESKNSMLEINFVYFPKPQQSYRKMTILFFVKITLCINFHN